ncbi:MAG TPA: cysteine--tRNA ligase [Candidatus Eremiobacteraceae bacterium]|jgi:cysteinyl-tRNA synthetase
MAVRVYNSRTRRLDELQPLSPPSVTIYVCGMTPNSHPHLGHARTFLTFDVLRRHLTARGFAVRFVQNVTDIDDKIIDRAKKDGIAWSEVVARFYGEYDACARRLGLLEADVAPRATQEIADIVEMIAGLVANGAAYETGDGVYFTVKSFARYGELSGRQIEELRAGVRFEVREQKNDPLDFALWKKAKPGEPTWESPWGPGRPGWHIECSAMARRYLGDTIDIHGGATDLIFPHHENEVAQTESFTGKHPMAVIWMHAGLLNVDGQKMSKSLGNFVPLVELLDRHSWAAIRYFFLQTGYRKPTNFTDEALEAATKGLRGLYTDLETLRAAAAELPLRATGALDAEEFDALLDDDLNTAGAIGWLQKRLKAERAAAARRDGSPQAAVALAERCLGVLGLPPNATLAGLVAAQLDVHLSDDARKSLAAIAGDGHADDRALIDRVVAMRLDARAAKDFAASDRLRDVLTSAGISLQDAKGETKWSVGASS